MAYQYLKLEKKEGVDLITIQRPQALNALNTDLLKEIGSCFIELERDPSARVAIITGEGKAFIAGADIAAMKEYGYSEASEFSELGQTVFNRIDRSSIISIAAINGFALGGGLELALACDMRIANNNAKLGLPEVSLGLIPGFGGTQRLSRLIGLGAAMEFILTAEMISGEEALRIGLVNKSVAQELLLDTVLSLAKSILSRGPVATREAKRIIKDGFGRSMSEGLHLEKHAFANSFNGAETKEGLEAFLEKRKPNFLV